MKVIIVGAGIGGLTLTVDMAQLAPRIEVELYERDAAAEARRKGYAIGLKGDAGLSVLERLGLWDDVLSIGAQHVTNFVSRRAARQFHTTDRFPIMNRNLGFRVANVMINSRLVRHRDAPTVAPRT